MPASLITGPHGLKSNVCHCGARKTDRQSFCCKCYYSLSRRIRNDLYRCMGDGYEQAHAEAMVELVSIGRVKERAA